MFLGACAHFTAADFINYQQPQTACCMLHVACAAAAAGGGGNVATLQVVCGLSVVCV